MATTCRHNPIQRPDPARVTQVEASPPAMPSDFANLPIREAASEVIDIEHSVPLDGEFDVALGDTFTDDAARITYKRQERTATICHYRLQRCDTRRIDDAAGAGAPPYPGNALPGPRCMPMPTC